MFPAPQDVDLLSDGDGVSAPFAVAAEEGGEQVQPGARGEEPSQARSGGELQPCLCAVAHTLGVPRGPRSQPQGSPAAAAHTGSCELVNGGSVSSVGAGNGLLTACQPPWCEHAQRGQVPVPRCYRWTRSRTEMLQPFHGTSTRCSQSRQHR